MVWNAFTCLVLYFAFLLLSIVFISYYKKPEEPRSTFSWTKCLKTNIADKN